MTTYNTGNPIGSKDPRDLYDNAENLDTAVNDTANDTWKDRFGRSRKTMSGMERQFDADQDLRDARFNTFIETSGYQFLGDYTAGIELTEYNQLVRENGEFWRVSGQVDLPYTTTGEGIPEDDALVPAGDAVLRQDLANPALGGNLVHVTTSTGEQTLTESLNSRLTYSDTDITVRIPTDYSNIQEALNFAGSVRNTNRSSTIIVFESGYVIDSGAAIVNGDYSHVIINSTDAQVQVDPLFTGNLLSFSSCMAPTINCLIDMQKAGSIGLLYEGSTGYITPGSGVINAGRDGIRCSATSSIIAYDSIFDGAGGNGISVQGSSSFAGSRVSAKNCFISGILLGSSSIAQARDSDFSGCAQVGDSQVSAGIVVDRSSSLDARGANCQNSGSRGAWIDNNSKANLRDVNVSGAVSDGFFLTRGAVVSVESAIANSTGGWALSVVGGCVVRATAFSSNGSMGTGAIYIAGSTLQGGSITIENPNNTGFLATDGARASVPSLTILSSGGIGLNANGSYIQMINSEITNSGVRGIFSTNSDINASGASITGSVNNAIRIEHGSKLNIANATVTSPTSTDIDVRSGSLVTGFGATTSSGAVSPSDVNGITSFNQISGNNGIFWA